MATEDDSRAGIQKAIQRFFSGESAFEELRDPSGTRFRLVRSETLPDHHRLEILAADGSWRTIMQGMRFAPAAERSPQYPDDLPFVVNHASILTRDVAGAMSMRWDGDTDGCLAQGVATQLTALGWEASSEKATGTTAFKTTEFVKGQRVLRMLSGPSVVLFDGAMPGMAGIG